MRFLPAENWLNTSRPNVLKLRNAFLGNASKKKKQKKQLQENDEEKTPKPASKKTVPGQVV